MEVVIRKREGDCPPSSDGVSGPIQTLVKECSSPCSALSPNVLCNSISICSVFRTTPRVTRYGVRRRFHGRNTARQALLLLITVIGVVEEVVGSKLFVFVASKVSLNDGVSLKTQTTELALMLAETFEPHLGSPTYSLDGFSLFLGHTDLLYSGWESSVVVNILGKQLHKLLRI